MAASGVTFTDNSKAVKAEMEKRIAQALQRIGMKWLENVRPLIPVDTSNLLKSATYEVDIAKKQVIVGIKEAGMFKTTNYAPMVELGTSKMSAQPYLKPSILNYVEDYKRECEKVLGEGWSVSINTSTISY